MRIFLKFFLFLMLSSAFYSCGSSKKAAPGKSGTVVTARMYSKSGTASYYHNKFNGRKTASGERFSNSKLTAAHRKLPFGTRVRVTNVANGKSVVVVINDRGPFKKSREIDLSKRAFMDITDNKNHGLLKVKLTIL